MSRRWSTSEPKAQAASDDTDRRAPSPASEVRTPVHPNSICCNCHCHCCCSSAPTFPQSPNVKKKIRVYGSVEDERRRAHAHSLSLSPSLTLHFLSLSLELFEWLLLLQCGLTGLKIFCGV